MTAAGSGAEHRLGPRARALAPRALARPGSAADPALRVALRAEALESRERAALEALPGASWHAPRPGLAVERELRLPEASLAALEELARSLPAAAVVLAAWRAASRPPARPRLMGVVNVTPDSFSDGGRFLDPRRAVEHGLELLAAGADVLDVGGESTRPGARPVGAEEELERVLPVVEGLVARCDAPLSIDTSKGVVARAALARGARWVNDVSAGLADPETLAAAAEHGATFVAMHMRGAPADMQRDPRYEEPVAEVLAFLRERAAACLEAGIPPERVVVDPGLGFGKRVEDNLALVARASELRSLGLPVLLGPSRKSFLAKVVERERAGARPGPAGAALPDEPARRIGGTLAAVTAGVLAGAEILRVHDVAEAAQAVAVAGALAPWSLHPGSTP